MNKRNWIMSSILAGSILTLGAGGIAHACGGPGGHRMTHMGGDNMGRMIEHLDLSAEQRQAIRAIKDAQRDQMRTRQDELRVIRKALHDQVSAENLDPAKVRELADAKAKIMADMTVQRTETMHQIRKQLSPEQLAKMDSFREKGFARGNF